MSACDSMTKDVPCDQAHDLALRCLFVSSTNISSKRPFDPQMNAFLQHNKKKKKARQKITKVEIVVISDLDKGISRGHYKTHLSTSKGIVAVELTRSMSAAQVRRQILEKVSHLDVREFSILACNGQHFVKASKWYKCNRECK